MEEIFSKFLIPWSISMVFALILLWLSIKRRTAARIIYILLFVGAGVFNIYTARTQPGQYVEGFGEHAVGPYQDFIYGSFAEHASMLVILIGLGQIAVSFLLAFPRKSLVAGAIGGIVFLVAIAPLGIGSAFPSSLIMAAGLVILIRNAPEKSIFHHLVKKPRKIS
ncbi:MAG: hypothetical protein ACLFQX_13870 [Candidatus Kapaibacterium sp.]